MKLHDAPMNAVWFRRIGILGLLVLGLGLPLARPEHFWLLMVALPTVLLNTPHKSRNAWGTAFVLCVLAALVRMLVGPGDIRVAANVFSPGNDHFHGVIPPPVLEAASADYQARYGSYELKVPRPVARNFGQWGLPEETTFKRRLLAIDSLTDWPLGAVNDRARNYNTHKYNNTRRLGSVPPTEVMHRQQIPYYAIVTFPNQHAGQRLCVRGNVFLRHEAEYQRVSSGRERECIVLPTASNGQLPVIAAYQTGSHDELQLHLDATTREVLNEVTYRALPWLLSVIAFVVLANLGSLTNRNRFVIVAMFIVATTTIVSTRLDIASRDGTRLPYKFSEILPLGAFVVHHEGSDGLSHAGLGRQVANAVLDGDSATALRGGEDIYHHQPGFRYVQAINLALFGPGSVGSALAGLLTTVALLGLTRRFLPDRRDWPFLLLWLLPILLVVDRVAFLGFGLSTPIRTGATFPEVLYLSIVGNAEPTGLLLLLLASAICLRLMNGWTEGIWLHTLAGLLMSFGILIRANWGLVAVIVLGGVAYTSFRHSNWKQVVALGCSVSPLLLMPLHNYWFGGEWVLTVDLLQQNSQWVVDTEVLAMAIALDPDAIARVIEHWGMLLTDGRIILIVASVVAVTMPSVQFWLRVFAVAALAGFVPYLFLVYRDRYVMLPDLFAALVFWRLVFFEGRHVVAAAWASARHGCLARRTLP